MTDRESPQTMSPVVVVVRDSTRDRAAVVWAARYAAATGDRLHLLHLQPPAGGPQPPAAGGGPPRDEMLDLQRLVDRETPTVAVTWDLTWRSPDRGEIGLPGSAGLLVVARWGDGRAFTAPSATSTVVVVPETSRGVASGVVAVVDPERDSAHVLAAARDFAAALATTLLAVPPSQASRASRNAELLVVDSASLHLPGAALSALSWSTRRAVAVVPDGESGLVLWSPDAASVTGAPRTGPPVAVGGPPGP